MKKFQFVITGAIVTALIVGSFNVGYLLGKKRATAAQSEDPTHQHQWSQWGEAVNCTNSYTDSESMGFIQFRRCTNCGISEMRFVRKNGD